VPLKLDDESRASLGSFARALAAREDISQQEMATRLDIDRATVSKLWRGEVKKTTHYKRLMKLFGFALDEALERARAIDTLLATNTTEGAPAMSTRSTTTLSPDENTTARSARFGARAMVLAVASQKGGTGKTTTSVNLAHELAERGHAVLLVDLDPQADATIHVGEAPTGEHFVEAVRGLKASSRGEDADASLEVISTAHGFDLVPSGEGLGEAVMRIEAFAVPLTVLRKLLAPYATRYDVILIDCQPTLGTLQKNAIIASTHLLFPVQLHQAAINGLDRMMTTVDELHELNPTLRVLGSVPCFEENTVLCREMARQLRERYYARVTDASIPKNVAVAEAYAAGEPVSKYDTGSAGSKAFAKLAREIEERLLEG
jgi:chromosome partitioning protein